MFRNYLTIALRTLRKHKGYTFINISGLAVGMACCLLIFMLVRHEWSYDRFHANADHLYRTCIEYFYADGTQNFQNMMFPEFTPALAAEFPAIEHATRVVKGTTDFEVGNETFRQDAIEVDAPFFQMFSYPLHAGDPATVLADPSGMVITEETAQAFFGLTEGNYGEALGETVSITRDGTTYDFTITGVAETIPNNSSLLFDIAFSFENYDNIRLGGNNWGGRTSTYIQLRADQDPEAFEAALKPFIDVQFADYIDALRSNGYLAEGDNAFHMFLQPLAELHLSPEVWAPYEEDIHNPRYSYILGGIGLLVLLIACINFMTLAVGRSAGRAREVGMRKVLGAQRGQLMKQFWGEALLLTGVSLVLGFGLALLALPFFNDLAGQSLSFGAFSVIEVLLTIAVLLFVVGFVAGGYPAALLSRFQPASVLKGEVKMGGKNWLTRSLVVVQYTVSIGLIVSTIVMAQQLNFLLDKDLGFEDELVVAVSAGQVADSDAPLVIDNLRNALLPYEQITHVERAGSSFTRGSDRNTWQDADGVTRSAYNFGVGVDYLDLMGMELVEGRNFSREFPSDSTQSVLVNEALVREFGIENPVGHQLSGWLSFVYEESPTIIGVVKDFNFQSLRNEVEPAVMNMHPNYYNYMGTVLMKIKPTDMAGTLDLIENAWAAAVPGTPFEYNFLDDDLARQYMNEQRWSTIVTYSSLFAILIACLGLFGLATLSVTKRTKEIGIRKVLGASVPSVVTLIAGEFVKLIAVAAVLAWPLAYFGMERWLESFAYRIDMGVGAFVLAAVGAMLIALATISYRAFRAAVADPVKALRTD